MPTSTPPRTSSSAWRPPASAMAAPPTQAPGVTSKAAALLLIAVMVVGNLLMWIGAPLFWLWLGSQLQSGSTPSFGPYLLILVGVVASMIVIGQLLSMIDRIYGRVTKT